MLKALMLRRSIELKETELTELRTKTTEFETREAELTAAIGEAVTAEEQAAVTAEVDSYTEQRNSHNAAVTAAEAELAELRSQLAGLEQAAPPAASPGHHDNERTVKMEKINFRALPISQRAFDALSSETRAAIVAKDSVKTFLSNVRAAATRSVNNADLLIPAELLDIIGENMYRYSKLMKHVRVRPLAGEGRQPVAGTTPEAVWTDMTGAINLMDLDFSIVNTSGYKVAGALAVPKTVLSGDDVGLAAYIVEAASESIGKAKDKAILYGKGAAYNMPMGIVTRLAQSSKPSSYPANAPAWVDLHSSNVQSIDNSYTGATFWAALTVAAGNAFSTYARGEMFWAMSSKTHALLKSKAISFTANGDVVSNVISLMPVINGNIEIIEDIPEGDIIGGYGDLYLWAQRGETSVEQYRETLALADMDLYIAKEVADGQPIIAGAFVAINIKGTSVTTSVDFASDKANDAALASLSIGETLSPTFAAGTLSYTATASGTSGIIKAIPAQSDAEVTITYDGDAVLNGETVTWETGTKNIVITVRNGNAVRVYTVALTKN